MAIKNHAQNIAIGVLAVLCLVLFIKGKAERSEYDRAIKQATADYNAVRDSQLAAERRANEFKERIEAMAGTIHELGSTAQNINQSVNRAADLNSQSKELIEQLRCIIEGTDKSASGRD